MGNQYGRTQNYLTPGASSQAGQYTSNVSGSPTAGPQAHFFGLAMPPKPNVPGVSNSPTAGPQAHFFGLAMPPKPNVPGVSDAYRKQGVAGYGPKNDMIQRAIQRAMQMVDQVGASLHRALLGTD